jgi:hypothetical protein
LDAIWPTSADVKYFPEQNLPTWRPTTVLLFRFWKDENHMLPNEDVYVELSQKDLNLKIQSKVQHKSQIGNLVEHGKYLTEMATQLGKPENTKYAEWFSVVRFYMP